MKGQTVNDVALSEAGCGLKHTELFDSAFILNKGEGFVIFRNDRWSEAAQKSRAIHDFAPWALIALVMPVALAMHYGNMKPLAFYGLVLPAVAALFFMAKAADDRFIAEIERETDLLLGAKPASSDLTTQFLTRGLKLQLVVCVGGAIVIALTLYTDQAWILWVGVPVTLIIGGALALTHERNYLRRREEAKGGKDFDDPDV